MKYRAPTPTKINSNLAHVRPRSNPTNDQTKIWNFEEKYLQPIVKCTPTFHSSIFWINPQKDNNRSLIVKNQYNKVEYCNKSR